MTNDKKLEESIETSMRTELEKKAFFKKADEIAALKVRGIFQPLVSAVSMEYLVEIVM